MLGPLIAQHYPVVPLSCQRNFLAAFDKRCNYHSDKRIDPVVTKANSRLLNRICPSGLDPIEWSTDLFHAWNAQFEPEKQRRHLVCLPQIEACTVKTFSSKQIFVKVEALLKRHDPEWAPRIIYQSSDLHNALLGPVMQACTKRMFNALDLATDPNEVVYCGAYKKTTEELCDFITYGASQHCKFVESDFSSNDMTQVKDVHLLEILWLRRLGAPEWLTALMLYANTIPVRSRQYGMRATIKNQLPSGAQSTTFRNTLWNATQVECFATRHHFRGKCLLLGDDVLLRVDNPWSRKQQIRRAYEFVTKQAHMKAKVKVRNHLSECEFLSKQFIMTANGFVLVPKLGKALGRFNASANNNSGVSHREYLAGKALSYAYEFRHVPPISRCFQERYLQLAPTGGYSLSGLGWFSKGMFLRLGTMGVLDAMENCKTCTRDDMTRFYHYKYGLTSTDVIELCLRFIFGEDDLDVAAVGRIIEDFVD